MPMTAATRPRRSSRSVCGSGSAWSPSLAKPATTTWCRTARPRRRRPTSRTHAKNAVRIDAEIGLKAVEHLLGTYTAARLRLTGLPRRCEACGSYEVAAGVCRRCAWADPTYVPPESREMSDEERTRRLAQPCTSSSDISTFVIPNNF